MKKRIAVLGATGSIGKSTLDILRENRDRYEPALFSAHRNREALLALKGEFPDAALALSGEYNGGGEIAFWGREGLLRALADSGADTVVNGIAGAAGLESSLVALENGADLALANKETIVMAGPLTLELAAKHDRRILPVDSEHSAIFSLINAHGKDSVDEILLTASGGPFRTYTQAELCSVSPRDALAHPTWNMGPKITIDSASLANKGLELIEAVGLFHVPPDRITVVIHPQSIVHSMTRLRDGTVYAALSKPDMRLPIQNALSFPECLPCPFGRLEFDALTLEFEKPDGERFPMLPLAYEAARQGGLYPAAYNAANEIAVAAFLATTVSFLDIPRIVQYVLNTHWGELGNGTGPGALEAIMETDKRARLLAEKYIAMYITEKTR
ncbi:MAG: 1-deoxy-D-xylulose-5-phosphate reductoisomerase [Treponema sp.]|jgi:1-deoxy-D-xylulose-5-phosphate reductoisomerase|nr:1-deoxy-D-xylulose-5-phosphate reductoisomerase [Treponema sp.]